MGISRHFGRENYAWKVDIIQNLCDYSRSFFCNFLGAKFRDTSTLYSTVGIHKLFSGCLTYAFWVNISNNTYVLHTINRRTLYDTTKKLPSCRENFIEIMYEITKNWRKIILNSQVDRRIHMYLLT